MQPMAMAPPPMKRKGGAALGIGIALVVLGIVGGVVGLVLGYQALQRQVDDMQRASLIQGGTIRLDESGTYKLFVERPTSGGGVANVQIMGPTGSPIALNGVAKTETYDIQGRHGKLLGSFEAPTSGSYELLVTPAMGVRNGGGQFAVAKDSPVGAFLALGGALFGALLVVVIGVVLIIVGAIKRSRSKRPPMGGYPQQGWGAPTSPPGWAPPPGQGWAPPPAPGIAPPQPPGGVPGPPASPPWTPPQTGGNTTWNPPS